MQQAVEFATSRLVLRHWRPDEAAIHRALWLERDARVPAHRRVDADGHPSVNEMASWIRDDDHRPFPGILAAVERASGAIVGYAGLIANTHGAADEPELAYEFFRAAWGVGYATEASRAVIAAASEAGYPRLWATVRDWNTASRHVLAKLGFVETDRVDHDAEHGDSIFTVLALRQGGRSGT
jgi:[ribosomal protein S5]-alanine N-acetyltransferase